MMEKLRQMKNKFLNFLPKRPVASVAAFQNPNQSPNRSFATKGCRSSAQMVSIIPKEARRKHRSLSFSAREPSSPKVSCMGQVQCKKKRKVKKSDSVQCHEKKKVLLWIFKGKNGEGVTQSGKALVLNEDPVKVAPSLSTMKKFASGRGSLSDFDATLAER